MILLRCSFSNHCPRKSWGGGTSPQTCGACSGQASPGTATEVGRRIKRSGNTSLTSRLWFVRPSISVDNLTDAVNSRVSFPDAHRFIGSGRAVAETTSHWGGGQFSLRSSLDIKRSFSGTETFAMVRGEKLSLESSKNGIVLGLAQNLTHEP